MTELLAVHPKKTADIDIARPLSNWISSTFGSSDDPIDASSDVEEFQRLRQAVARLSDTGENGLSALSNYFDQLVAIDKKIPVSEVQIPFKWKDAFDKGSIFGGRISLTVPSFAYERVCVLFNMGAISSLIAAGQNFESDDGLQKAIKRLQSAAGIFAHLKETSVGAIQRDPTPDLDPDTLGILADLMLAQAQEMIAIKAMKDHAKKPAIVAKVCSQCEDMYAGLMRSIQKESVRNLWDSTWLQSVSGKQAIYNGLAQYHQSRVSNAEKSVGEEIARLQYATRLFTAGIERSTHPDLCNVREWLKKTERALTDAKKDNDFIYHERIPEERALASIAKAAVAKPTALPEKFGNMDKTLFDNLVPVVVHQAMAAFDVRKKEIVNREITRLKEATNLANAAMASMNLPAAIEITGKNNELPQSMREKSTAIINAGGPDGLKKLINELPELLTRNTEILDEGERMLREEAESDEQLKNQFKEKWTRTSSDKLNGTFKSNAQKYRTIINNATDADKVVRDKFETHRSFIEMLANGSNAMESQLPDASGQVKQTPVVEKLRKFCEDMETLKAERQAIEAEIKEKNVDMKQIFLNANASGGSINESEMSTETLNGAFRNLIDQVNDNLKRQENTMKELSETNEQFVKENGGQNSNNNARDEMLKKLAAAHDAYFELQNNLQEGTKFYNDLTQLLVTFQNKVSDFCFARKTEKDELMKDLTSGLSQMDLNQSQPTPPAHHVPVAEEPTRPPRAKDGPPARPPPPQISSESSAPPPAVASAPNPYAGAPAPQPASNPYAGAPPQHPAVSAPPAHNPYAGAPPPPAGQPPLPYPTQPGMPMPYQPYTPMPGGYNPYQGYPQQPYYPPHPGQAPYAPYGYPPQGAAQQPPPAYYPPGQQPPNPGQPPQWR